jgi:hypothetical protein
VTAQAAAVIALAAVLALAGGAASSPAARVAQCPSGALALPANPIAPASQAALRAEQTRDRPQVVAAVIASGDSSPRARQVRTMCGAGAASRTVVVSITLRVLLPSQSLSQRVSFVSRFGSGYRVWLVAH